MITLLKLLSLPSLLSMAFISRTCAAPQGFIDEDTAEKDFKYASKLTGGEGCSNRELKKIREGFHEMHRLFQAALSPDWEGEAELEFFGRPERIRNYTDMIEGNLRRAAQYGNLESNTNRNLSDRNPDIHVRCDDPNDACLFGGKKSGRHTVYNIGHDPHINFCKDYFELDGLDDQVEDGAKDDQSKNYLMRYYNRATAWARMVMHISGVGEGVVVRGVANPLNTTSEWRLEYSEAPMNTSVLAGVIDSRPDTNQLNNIRVLKYAFGVTRAKLLVSLSTQNPYDAANNAENYALYAQARFVMGKKNFFPSLPIMNFGNDMAVLTNEMIQNQGDKKKFACFTMPDVLPLQDGTNRLGGPLQSTACAVRHRSYFAILITLLSVALAG